jgi:gliding motility-associated-like protein
LAPYVFTYSINGGANQTVSSGAGNTATVSVPTGTVGTFTYTLVDVSSASGCGQPQTGSSTVTVIQLPTATISGTATICQNAASPVITFTGANGTAPYTFTYNINGGANQTASSGAGNTATINASTSTSGTFTYNLVSVSSANTCAQAQTGSAVITVDPLPTATISGGTSVCQNGTSPVVTFTGANGTAPYTFTYNINGGASQTVTTVSGNSVTVAAPTGTVGTFTYNLLSVSGNNGCAQAQTGSTAVVVQGLPSAVIAGNATVCLNGTSPTITFTGSAGTAPYTFTYNLNGGANQTLVSNAAGVGTITAPTTTAGTFNYSLVSVASSTGCSQAAAGNAVVTVDSPANGAISGTTTVCQGDPGPVITFTGSNDAPSYTFTYNINGGASQTVSSGAASSTASVTAITTSSGTFTYNLLNVVGANGCPAVLNQSATITVNPTPTASLSPDLTFCEGGFGNIVITGTPNATVSYNVGAANSTIVLDGTGVATIVTNTISTTTSFTLTLTSIQSASGCTAALNSSVDVTINPAPVVDAIADIEVCPGASVAVPAFTATPAGATFGWSNNNTSIGLGANGLGNIAPFNGVNASQSDNTATITVAATLNGCVGSTETFQITVHPTPAANAGTDVAVCEDASLPFIGSPAVAGNTYQWTPATGLSSSTAANPQVQNNTPGTTNYSLTVTSAFGCTNTDNVQVTFNPLPTVSFNADAEGCSPLTVTFTNTSANSVDCVWDIEGIGIVNSCGSFSEVFTNAGTYDVTLTITDVNGCTNSLTENDIIKVYPQAVAAFDVDAVSQSVLNPEFHFTNTSTNASSYQWNFGDGSTSTAVNPVHLYPYEENAYTVQLIANNEYNCPDVVSMTINVTQELIIYVPNTFTPDGDEHNNTFYPVLSSGFDKFNYTLYIFNRWGEIIFESHDPDFGWDGTYHDQLCMDGVYVWKIVVKEKNKDKFLEYVGHVSLLR